MQTTLVADLLKTPNAFLLIQEAQMILNQNPIVLELACGRGEYSVGLAQVYPEKNFIGIDVGTHS